MTEGVKNDIPTENIVAKPVLAAPHPSLAVAGSTKSAWGPTSAGAQPRGRRC